MLGGDIGVCGGGWMMVVIWVHPNAVRYVCEYGFLCVDIRKLEIFKYLERVINY